MKINLNDHVTVTPNAKGWAIWEKYYTDLNVEPPTHGETLETELWMLAHVFGASLYNGCNPPFFSMVMGYRKST